MKILHPIGDWKLCRIKDRWRTVSAISLLSMGLCLLVFGCRSQGLVAESPASQAPKSQSGQQRGNIPILYDKGVDLDNHAAFGILATKPPQLLKPELGNIGAVRWTGDHRGVLVTDRKTGSTTLHFYDSVRHSFGSAQNVAKSLANPGVRYDLPSVYDFDCSPDGRYIVFSDEKGLTLFDLKSGKQRVILPPSPRRFTRTEELHSFEWSPDSKQIAFSVSGKDQATLIGEPYEDLWVMRADGTKLHKIGHGTSPSWSPDGRYIVAIAGTRTNGKRVYRYDLLRGARRLLRSARLGDYGFVSYSPDGKQIAMFGSYGSKDKFKDQCLFLTDTNGNFQRELATFEQLKPITYPVDFDW